MAGVVVAGVVVAGVVVAGVPAAGASTTTTAPTPASAQLAATLAAAKAQPSVHFSTTTVAGAKSYTVVGDASKTGGVQEVTVVDGTRTGHVQVRLIGRNFYIQGDDYGLTTYVGMPSNLAATYKNRWIVFGPSTPDFTAIAKSMTVSAAVDQISMKGPLTMATAQVAGSPAIVLTGTTTSLSAKDTKGPATLVVTADGTDLPLSFSGQGTDGTTVAKASITYSRWGQPVTVARPAHAVPSTKV